MKQTEAELFLLANSLLDPRSRQAYGENAVFICLNALGITSGSTIETDTDGYVVPKSDALEVERRIAYVREQRNRGIGFERAMNRYFTENPPPDPLARFRKLDKTQENTVRKTRFDH